MRTNTKTRTTNIIIYIWFILASRRLTVVLKTIKTFFFDSSEKYTQILYNFYVYFLCFIIPWPTRKTHIRHVFFSAWMRAAHIYMGQEVRFVCKLILQKKKNTLNISAEKNGCNYSCKYLLQSRKLWKFMFLAHAKFKGIFFSAQTPILISVRLLCAHN